MRCLLRVGGYPQKSYRRVLIAGTKGKGSTGFLLETLLENAGVKTGFYSSPHLNEPRERIRIRGQIVSKEKFAEGLSWVKRVILSGSKESALKTVPSQKNAQDQFRQRVGFRNILSSLTYFEVMTLLAAYLFKQAKIEMGIFEVGMGGRLDATNTLDHELSIITPIGLDHEAFLGNTISKIADEKAAIIRHHSKVVVSPQVPEAWKVIRQKAAEQNASIIEARPCLDPLPLAGDFQAINAGAALAAVYSLGFKIQKPDWRTRNSWPGRLEWLGPHVLIDAAHNPMSVQAVVQSIQGMKIKNPVIIFGTSQDKNAKAMLKALSRLSREIILAPLSNPRGFSVAKLIEYACPYFSIVIPSLSARDAWVMAQKRSNAGKSNRKILALGSFYLIGDIKKNHAES